jgi:hypothetical protein
MIRKKPDGFCSATFSFWPAGPAEAVRSCSGSPAALLR